MKPTIIDLYRYEYGDYYYKLMPRWIIVLLNFWFIFVNQQFKFVNVLQNDNKQKA